MREGKKLKISSFFLCVLFCLSLCGVSFGNLADVTARSEFARVMRDVGVPALDSHSSKGASLSEGKSAVSVLDSEVVRVAASGVVGVHMLLRTLPRREQLKSFFNFIFAVLFKIAVIPSLMFVVMGSCICSYTPLRQLILRFIQNKDGKKRPLF